MGGLILTKSAACLFPNVAGGKFSCVRPSANAFCGAKVKARTEGRTRTAIKAMARSFPLPVFTRSIPQTAYLIVMEIGRDDLITVQAKQ
jgi:hypothetical protein